MPKTITKKKKTKKIASPYKVVNVRADDHTRMSKFADKHGISHVELASIAFDLLFSQGPRQLNNLLAK